MLTLAGHLRASAESADRPDVVAQVDEVILLIAGEDDEPEEAAKKPGPSKTEAVLRILNGLGF